MKNPIRLQTPAKGVFTSFSKTMASLSMLGLLALEPVSATEWKSTAGTPPVNQDWNNASNWTSGVPGGGFFIRNITGGLYPIIDGDLAATANGNSFIGAFSATNSRLDIRSGSLGITGTLLVGPDNPSGAILNLANTATIDAGNLTGFGLGSGSLSTTGAITLARRNNSTATLNINTSGTFSASGESQILVGGGGTAVVNLVNGSLNTVHFAGGLVLGGLSDQNDDGGSPARGNGTVNMSGGTIGDGTSSNQRFIRVGRQGAGTFNQTGGTIALGDSFNSGFEIGIDADSTGTYSISGGSATMQRITVGMAGSGTLTVSGTANLTANSNGTLTIVGGGSPTGDGMVNLDGGTLTVSQVRTQAADPSVSESIFNFNGGTLRAGSASASFFQGLTEANILGGGAIIDSNGFNITIAQQLQGAGDLTKRGAGTLTLSSLSNTVTGDVNVENGTLSIESPFMNSGAIVNIAAGSFLNLNYLGDNVISGLFYDGVDLGLGTFDSSETFLTGTGTLSVIPEPSTFALLGIALVAAIGLRRGRK